jgi:hypothetical protein
MTTWFSPRTPIDAESGAVPVIQVGSVSAGGVSSLPSGSFVATKTVAFDATDGPAAAAVLSTALAGANNDLDITAVTAGRDGNSITVAYVDPGTPSAALGVVVTGTAIVVNLATDGSSVITSTAAEVDAAIDGEAAAAALVTPANKAANDGTGVVTAMAATALTGGVSATRTLFDVTGIVRAKVFAHCTESLAGATATLQVGTSVDTDAQIPSTVVTTIDATALWYDAAYELTEYVWQHITYGDIISTAGVAVITDGTLVYYCIWEPVSADGAVVAA